MQGQTSTVLLNLKNNSILVCMFECVGVRERERRVNIDVQIVSDVLVCIFSRC